MKFLNTWQNKDGTNVDLDGHTHTASEVTDFAATVRVTVLTGLSTATNAVIAATDTVLGALGKLQAQITSHTDNISNPHSVTKTQVGLGSVDNTADSSKAVYSAGRLTTARTINGTSFNGTANITTANWGTARVITIGSTGKSVNGSAAVAWTLPEIGAAAATHGHAITEITGMPTKLSEFENDIAAGRGTVFTLSATAPADPVAGDFWNKIL